jgi:DNA-binding NarL/FixJ family response regulator
MVEKFINSSADSVVRILIIEDHSLVREAIKAILFQKPEFLVVGEAETGKEGINAVKKLKPDVVLLDIELPDISGMQVARRIMQSMSVKIIALTSQSDEVYLNQLSKLGVDSYLTKECKPAELLEAIVGTIDNQPYLTQEVAEQISFSYLNQMKNSPLMSLSQRELEIFIMISHGEKTAEIAKKLFLSPKTVNKHRLSLLKKLGAKNDIALAKLALHYGIIK